MYGIITPVIGRTSLAGSDGCLLLLPIWGILRQAGGNDPCWICLHSHWRSEKDGRISLYCLESTFRQ